MGGYDPKFEIEAALRLYFQIRAALRLRIRAALRLNLVNQLRIRLETRSDSIYMHQSPHQRECIDTHAFILYCRDNKTTHSTERESTHTHTHTHTHMSRNVWIVTRTYWTTPTGFRTKTDIIGVFEDALSAYSFRADTKKNDPDAELTIEVDVNEHTVKDTWR